MYRFRLGLCVSGLEDGWPGCIAADCTMTQLLMVADADARAFCACFSSSVLHFEH
jgi:hypothetical protein